MKNPLFEDMGKDYPVHLEAQFGRILRKIEELWDSPRLDEYFSDLLIDKRGGRQGFPEAVLKDLIMIREYRDVATFRAVERKEDAIFQLQAKGVPFNRDGFMKAFEAGDKELVDLFVRAQLALPLCDDQGTPLLLSALKKGHTIVARIVLGAGADVYSRDKLGLTPLLVACGKTTTGYRVIAEGLIARGANVNVHDPLGNTPLLLALTGGMFDIARLLIEQGADVSVASRHGETPLSLARKSDSPEAAEIIDMLIGRLAKEPSSSSTTSNSPEALVLE
jgi:tankyrase